ncbi:MAG: c-type cytochrome [Candidatus Longimicrobiales bacterium M2_2A_002]
MEMQGTHAGAGLLMLVAGLTTLPVIAATPADAAPNLDPDRTGREIYETTCAACHGMDGTGAPPTQVGFEVPLPDFTDCNFASREPDADWVAVAHEGGPVRGFDHTMPSFGGARSVAELQAAVDYIRTFCGDPSWPRGELNMPRPMFTEKAYPEEEAVFTLGSSLESPVGLSQEIVYESRFGARSQWELVVPYAVREDPAGGWTGGLGDIAFGIKHALWHNAESGSILSVTGEVILPLGDEDDGVGSGTTIFEPFVSFGQLLPANAFLQVMVGSELPTNTDLAEREGFWRAVLGKSFRSGQFGRVWSPMVEVLGARAFESGAEVEWDIVPQMQVTLNTRQHVMGNIAVRIPVDDPARDPQLYVYVLWDWFDGGFFEGW